MITALLLNIQKELPKSMQKVVRQLQKAKNEEECLKIAYKVLTKKFRGEKNYYLKHPTEIFLRDFHKIWNQRESLTCVTSNYLLRTLLVESGWFSKKDIRNSWTMIRHSPHQYLKVKIRKALVNIDLWGHAHGIPFGQFAT